MTIEYLIVFFSSMLPLTELRAAVPLGIVVFNLSEYVVLLLAVVGNIIPVFFLLWGLPLVTDYLTKKSSFFEKFFKWLFKRTRDRTTAKFVKYGAWALVLFVAIPLPGTGAWTGSLAAFIFNIPKLKSFWLICLGVALSGIFVTLATIGLINLFIFI